MLLPLSVDVGLIRRPWANWGLILFTSLMFFGTPDWGSVQSGVMHHPLIFDGFGPGVITHVFVHADWAHLVGNMLFLWVFGNAVCARVGSLPYVLLYFAFAVGTVSLYGLFSSVPACGASGAINGVVGMFVVFHPKDYVRLGHINVLFRSGEVQAWVIVGLWFALDCLGMLAGGGDVAYAGHVGGFVTGFACAIFLLRRELVPEPFGATVLDLYWRK